MLAPNDSAPDNRAMMSDASGFEKEIAKTYDQRTMARTGKFAGAVNSYLSRQDKAPLDDVDPESLRLLLEAYKLEGKLDGAFLEDEERADAEKAVLYTEALEAYMFDVKSPKEVFCETEGGKQWRRENPGIHDGINRIRSIVAERIAEFIVDQRDKQAEQVEREAVPEMQLDEVLRQMRNDAKISDTVYIGMLDLFELHGKPADELSSETQSILRLCRAEASQSIRSHLDNMSNRQRQTTYGHTLNQLVGDQRNTTYARTFSTIVQGEMHRSRNPDEAAIRTALQSRAAVVLDDLYAYRQDY